MKNLVKGILLLACFANQCLGQDLEPRRWSHMPTGLNFLGTAVAYTEGDIFFDPVLQVRDATFENASSAFIYLRSFGMFEKSARVDVVVPYASGRWEGLLEGEPAKTRRRGFGDPRVRLSMLLYGGPAESPEVFATSEKSNTVVGLGLSVWMPFGDYRKTKLLNLGTNRWIIRPQLGVTRHGANATVNGVDEGARVENWMTALSLGVPINRQHGVKIAWLRNRTQNDTGADFDSLVFAWSMMF
jgi:hypothetical protein